jgi:hypothetical protein
MSENPTVYVKNEEGAVQSVTQEHFDKYLTTTTNAGRTFILPGWEIIKEAEAKKAHPQLFGEPDPDVYLSDDELVKALARKKALAELRNP